MNTKTDYIRAGIAFFFYLLAKPLLYVAYIAATPRRERELISFDAFMNTL